MAGFLAGFFVAAFRGALSMRGFVAKLRGRDFAARFPGALSLR